MTVDHTAPNKTDSAARPDSQEIAQLVIAARNGCRESSDELFRRAKPIVEALLHRRIADYQLAEDIRQEVLLRAFIRIDTLREPGAFIGWICQIARREAYTLSHRRPSFKTLSFDVLVLGERTAAHTAEHNELAHFAHEVLETLRPIDRSALELRELEGLSYQEIADRLNCPLGTAKRRIHYARIRLTAAFSARFADSL